MEHFTFSISNIALQLRQQSDSRCYRHILKHILLPILTCQASTFRKFRRKVTGNDLLLFRIRHHCKDTLTERIYRIIKFLSLTGHWGKHHCRSSLEIILMLNIIHIPILSIGLTYYSDFQLLSKIIERVAHLLYLRSFREPGFHLGRIFLHPLFEVIIDRCVLT